MLANPKATGSVDLKTFRNDKPNSLCSYPEMISSTNLRTDCYAYIRHCLLPVILQNFNFQILSVVKFHSLCKLSIIIYVSKRCLLNRKFLPLKREDSSGRSSCRKRSYPMMPCFNLLTFLNFNLCFIYEPVFTHLFVQTNNVDKSRKEGRKK
jgi:hypothetical protein